MGNRLVSIHGLYNCIAQKKPIKSSSDDNCNRVKTEHDEMGED